jgi:hypothetical protein
MRVFVYVTIGALVGAVGIYFLVDPASWPVGLVSGAFAGYGMYRFA